MGCGSNMRDGGLSRVIGNYEDTDYQESISIADRIL